MRATCLKNARNYVIRVGRYFEYSFVQRKRVFFSFSAQAHHVAESHIFKNTVAWHIKFISHK